MADADTTDEMETQPAFSSDDLRPLFSPTVEQPRASLVDEAPTEQLPMAFEDEPPAVLDPPTTEEDVARQRERRRKLLENARRAPPPPAHKPASAPKPASRRPAPSISFRSIVLAGATLVAIVSVVALWHPWETERVVIDAASNPGICSPGVEGTRVVEYLTLFGRRLRKTGETTVCSE